MREGSYWISISDMMAGLMMVFLLITVSYMYVSSEDKKRLQEQNAKLKELNQKMSNVALTYNRLQRSLYEELKQEFSSDLEEWNAIITPDNSVRFKEPDVLFDTGRSSVKERFKEILNDFFPRYVEILAQRKYRESVEEIRIEGHTSSEWMGAKDLDERYIKNTKLSQDRAYSVLAYCFRETIDAREQKEWLIKVLRANGLSFAKPLEDKNSSRRVEFRTLTKASKRVLEILDISGELKEK